MAVEHRTGECKTTGGKLVAIDLEISDRHIVSARIRGDFFIHPEPACVPTVKAIAQSLSKLPLDMDTMALQAHIQASIPFAVELIGITPESIAIAFQRAVTGDPESLPSPTLDRIGQFTTEELAQLTESWKTLPWRLIPEKPLSPVCNVALDEVLTERVIAGERLPTLRFWRWTDPAVIIGRTQSVSNEVDRLAAQEMGVQLVRRMTGGGAMFLQPHGAITYSLYLPDAVLARFSIRQSYEVCESWVIAALREIGVDAHHVPINDIACSEGKIGGAAQARRGGIVLHHTTIAYDMDPGAMVRVLRIGREKLRDKATPSAAKRVSPLVRQTGLAREAIVTHLFNFFQKRFGGTLDTVSEEEFTWAESLIKSKYANPAWTHEFE